MHRPPQPLTEGYIRACCRVVDQGRASRGCIVRLLRMWRYESQRFGADLTLGLAGRLLERAGIDPIELESREELLRDQRPDGRGTHALTADAAAAEAQRILEERSLLQLECFKQAAIGGAPVSIARVTKQGRVVRHCNDAFARVMGGVGFPGRHMQTCKVLIAVVGASVCAPGDRELFLEVRWALGLVICGWYEDVC